jgi:hypothetical protein
MMRKPFLPISKPKKYNKIIIAGHSEGSLIGMIAAITMLMPLFLLPVLEELLMLL